MHVLDSIHGPDDLKALPAEQLPALAEEIRTFLVDSVSKTGRPPRAQPRRGRADHRAAPGVRLAARHDRLRHRPPVLRAQAAHRPARLQQAQEAGRPLGLPEPGRVRARRRGELPRVDRAVLGRRHRQGAPAARASATGTPSRSSATARSPAAWRGRRSTTSPSTRTCPWSSSSTTTAAPTPRPPGGMADHLATLRTTRGYERFLDWGKSTLKGTPVVGGAMYGTLHGMKKGLKDIVAPQGMFEDLGLKYLGPVDGHDEQAVESALSRARAYGGPVHRPRPHAEGPRLRTGPQRRGRPVPRRRRVQPRDRAAVRGGRPHLDRRVQRRAAARSAPSAPTSSPSPPPC